MDGGRDKFGNLEGWMTTAKYLKIQWTEGPFHMLKFFKNIWSFLITIFRNIYFYTWFECLKWENKWDFHFSEGQYHIDSLCSRKMETFPTIRNAHTSTCHSGTRSLLSLWTLSYCSSHSCYGAKLRVKGVRFMVCTQGKEITKRV